MALALDLTVRLFLIFLSPLLFLLLPQFLETEVLFSGPTLVIEGKTRSNHDPHLPVLCIVRPASPLRSPPLPTDSLFLQRLCLGRQVFVAVTADPTHARFPLFSFLFRLPHFFHVLFSSPRPAYL